MKTIHHHRQSDKAGAVDIDLSNVSLSLHSPGTISSVSSNYTNSGIAAASSHHESTHEAGIYNTNGSSTWTPQIVHINTVVEGTSENRSDDKDETKSQSQ